MTSSQDADATSTSRAAAVPRVEDLQTSPHPRKVLLAASTGGHLAQLARLSRSWNLSDDSLWVTFDTPQSRSLLGSRRVLHVPYIKPRDVVGVAHAVRAVTGLLREERFDMAVSTGAALATAVLPAARMRRIPATYIESLARVTGPSLTGRILSTSRLTALRTQHPSWATDRWKVHPSVLAQFRSRPREAAAGGPLKLFVTLGTIGPYRFDALIDAVLATGLAGEDSIWQVGVTTRNDLPGRTVASVSAADFERFAREADVVVTHAGVGTILNLLEWGVHPVAVPRRRRRSEHVDDHQTQIAALVRDLDVATVAEAPDLRAAQLLRARDLASVELSSPVASAERDLG